MIMVTTATVCARICDVNQTVSMHSGAPDMSNTFSIRARHPRVLISEDLTRRPWTFFATRDRKS